MTIKNPPWTAEGLQNQMPHTNTNIPGRQAGGVMAPSGRLWPNGEFSFGYSCAGGAEPLESGAEYAAKWDKPIGSSLPSNSHTQNDDMPPRRGTRGLTTHGKRMLRNCVWRMQRLYGKRCLSFVTLTLPSLTFEESWYVSSNWSQIVRVFYQKLGRRLESLNMPVTYAGCTEMQPLRCQREEHPALHLHFLVVGRLRPRGGWALHPREFREIWQSVLENYIRPGYDFSATENVQMVRKNASSYMAKYVSKGCSMEEPPRGDEIFWSLPTSWYNVSLQLRRYVNDNIRRDPDFIEMLEDVARIPEFSGEFHYLFWGSVEEMSGPGPHYCVGKIRGEPRRELENIWWVLKFGGP